MISSVVSAVMGWAEGHRGASAHASPPLPSVCPQCPWAPATHNPSLIFLSLSLCPLPFMLCLHFLHAKQEAWDTFRFIHCALT